MATDYHKILHIDATEEEVWNALLNNHNLERAVNMDSRDTIYLKEHNPFVWIIGGERIVGTMKQVDTVDTSSTQLVYEWRFDDQQYRDIWPEGHFATTTLTLGDQGDTTFIEMWIRKIPGQQGEQTRSRHLWQDTILRRVEDYLENKHPELEEALV